MDAATQNNTNSNNQTNNMNNNTDNNNSNLLNLISNNYSVNSKINLNINNSNSNNTIDLLLYDNIKPGTIQANHGSNKGILLTIVQDNNNTSTTTGLRNDNKYKTDVGMENDKQEEEEKDEDVYNDDDDDDEYYNEEYTEPSEILRSQESEIHHLQFYNDDNRGVFQHSGTHELLPEAKSLVQLTKPDDEDDGVGGGIVVIEQQEKPEEHVNVNQREYHDGQMKDDEEEEDMGYDEDDERLLLERPKVAQSLHYQSDHLANSHVSAVHGSSSSTGNNGRKDANFAGKYWRNKPKNKISNGRDVNVNDGDEDVDLRESSGNFANDDEDNDDDSDDDDDELSEGFFNTKRKINNDAIKIISTPLGKVGIVYQQTPNQPDSNNNNNKEMEINYKKSNGFTDFDALSPDPDSSHRLASSHPKITPVITPDGKVALLYRGDSENTKYEPIKNLTTHKFHHKQLDFDTKTDTRHTEYVDNNESENYESNSKEFSHLDRDHIDQANNKKLTVTAVGKSSASPSPASPASVNQAAILQTPEVTAAVDSAFIIRSTGSVLPMINRPLSEVLGIKKNQFKQFRIKDTPTTVASETTVQPFLNNNNNNNGLKTFHKMHEQLPMRINLGNYPSITRTRNYDFDFSRDNTMLDERSRHKGEGNTNAPTDADDNFGEKNANDYVTNKEVLAKTEVVNLAIIPHFDDELNRLHRGHDYDSRRHHRQRQRYKQTEDDLSGIHCIMQVMMAVAAISTVFGMLGTFFKQRILDQMRLMHW